MHLVRPPPAHANVCFTFAHNRQPTISSSLTLSVLPDYLLTDSSIKRRRSLQSASCLPFSSNSSSIGCSPSFRPSSPVMLMTLLRPFSIVNSQAPSSSTQPTCPPSNTSTMTTDGFKEIAGLRKQIIGERASSIPLICVTRHASSTNHTVTFID